MLNDPELRSIGVDHKLYPAAAEAAAVTLVKLPVVEGAAATDLDAVHTVVTNGVAATAAGGRVVIHCRGGVGRAGMLAACFLLQSGECKSAKKAIEKVRQRRCKQAIETRRQEDLVKAYAAFLKERAGAGS